VDCVIIRPDFVLSLGDDENKNPEKASGLSTMPSLCSAYIQLDQMSDLWFAACGSSEQSPNPTIFLALTHVKHWLSGT
jgi:hypothetical protein